MNLLVTICTHDFTLYNLIEKFLKMNLHRSSNSKFNVILGQMMKL